MTSSRAKSPCSSRRRVPGLVVRPVASSEDIRLAKALIDQYSCTGRPPPLRWLEDCGDSYPGYVREHTWVAVQNGALTGAVRIVTETVRIGEARLKMGGLSGLSVDTRVAGDDVRDALIASVLDYMRDRRYHMAMAFGTAAPFLKHGFVPAVPDYAVEVDTVDALKEALPSLRMREAKPGDISAVNRLHNQSDQGVACSFIRTAAHMTNKWERLRGRTKVLVDPEGRIVAYAVIDYDADALEVEEVGAGECPEAVFAACAHWAAEAFKPRIRFQLPDDHPFACFLLQRGSQYNVRIAPPEGGLVRLVDVGEALESMLPEWERLLTGGNAGPYRTECTLMLAADPRNGPGADACFRIRANRGAVDVAGFAGRNKVRLTVGDLAHLVTGYRHPADVLAERRRLMTEEARGLVNTIFPKRNPHIWRFDRF